MDEHIQPTPQPDQEWEAHLAVSAALRALGEVSPADHAVMLSEQLHAERLKVSVSERELRKEAEHAATHDPLTGLLNRRGLQELVEGGKVGAGDIVVSIDLDNFKQYNDTYGHPDGDEALVTFTQTLRTAVRPDDIVVRTGGDEFLAILKHNEDAPEMAQTTPIHGKPRKAHNETSFQVDAFTERLDKQQVGILEAVGYSAGSAIWEQGQSFEEVVVVSDKDLYRNKLKNKNGDATHRADDSDMAS